ncbi:AAA family ATPase, partial [Streptomyces olivaceoviridis]
THKTPPSPPPRRSPYRAPPPHPPARRWPRPPGEGVVVHDCGTQPWVRAWLAREARRRGATLHLLLLDVSPETARAGQRERGRGVSRYAFRRHRRTTARLLRAVEKGALPAGCGAAVLLDRDAADVLSRVGFAR